MTSADLWGGDDLGLSRPLGWRKMEEMTHEHAENIQ